jgi:menaquinone-9 beta-reductase
VTTGRCDEHDVLVVGGGPAGSAVAVFMRQLGHEVLLIDGARFPRDKICGEGVSPGAWPLLAATGAVAAIRELRPWALEGMALRAPDGTSFAGFYRGAERPGFSVRRDVLDATLLASARAAGVVVREGVRATDVLTADRRVVGVLTEDSTGHRSALRARVVIAADGRQGLVARRLGLLSEDRCFQKFAVRGYWEDVAGLGRHGEMHVGGGGYCGIAPHSATAANVTFVLDRRDMGPAGDGLEAFYRSGLARWPDVHARLAEARLLEPPRAIGPLALEAKRLWAPGVLLVGDAAGFYDPFTGEGVTLALRSAELAAPAADAFLRTGRVEALRGYAARRAEATRDKFRFNRLLQRVVAWPELANLVARRLARRPALADRLVSIAGDFVPARGALDLRLVYDLLTA